MSVTLSASPEDRDVEVTRVDQNNINEFGKLNAKRKDMQEDLSGLKVQKQLDNVTDAEEAVMLADESTPGAIKLFVGEAFVDATGDSANDFITNEKARLEQEVKKIGDALVDVTKRMDELKKILYGKFGRSINLEE